MAPKAKGKLSWIMQSDPQVHPVTGNIWGAYLSAHRGKKFALDGIAAWIEKWVQDGSPSHWYIWDADGHYDIDMMQSGALKFPVDIECVELCVSQGVLKAGSHVLVDNVDVVESCDLPSYGNPAESAVPHLKEKVLHKSGSCVILRLALVRAQEQEGKGDSCEVPVQPTKKQRVCTSRRRWTFHEAHFVQANRVISWTSNAD